MKIMGLGKPEPDGEKTLIVVVTEDEFDMITGVKGKSKQASRYKAGVVVNVAEIYSDVDRINKGQQAFKDAVKKIKNLVADLEGVDL